MILADKIIELRKKNGWSQEELAEKLDVSRQSISKWEGAQSVPDMNKILRLSELFGVSTDYLLKDELESCDAVALPETDAAARSVTMEDAAAFLRIKAKNAAQIALGVFLCILSPVLLIVLGGAQDAGRLTLTENQAGGLGLIALIVLIGLAVALFIVSGFRANKYEYMEKEAIDTLYGVSGMVKERKEQFRPVFVRQLTIGIVLCVLSVVPIGVSLLFGGDKLLPVLGTAGLLLLVAFGVLLIVRAGIIWGGFQILLEEGDYSRESKAEQKKLAVVAGIYWPAVTAVYLAWSFLTNDWHRTWIIWPVAGVAYGVVFAIVSALKKKNG